MNEEERIQFFVSGARPAIIWVCAVALACAYIPKCLVMSLMWTYQSYVLIGHWSGQGQLPLPAYPDLGVTDLIGLVGSILGMSALRSVDKFNKVASK